MEYTLALHKEVKNKTFDGQIGIDDFKNYLKLALESEKEITEELSKFSKDELIKYANSYTIRPSDKKEFIISHIYTDIIAFFALGSYSWSFGQDKYAGIISKVENFTQKNLDDYAIEVAKEREDYKKRLEAHKKALSNPETLQEFQTFIKYKGKNNLTTEQAAIYDELIGLNTKENQSKEIEQKAIISKVNVGENVDFNIYETKHTKTGQQLYVVKLSERVSKEDYIDLNNKAKKLGGFYSSYTKDGAIAGFQFKNKEDAEKFVSLKQGDVSNIEKIEEKQEQKAEKRASKLRENAESIIERVDNELNKDRQTNTARRASMASSIEARLNGEKSIAKTMINLANAIELGETKFLDLVRTKVQVEQLNSIISNANYNFLRKKYTNYSEYEARKYDTVTAECIEYVSPYMMFFPLIHVGNWQSAINKNGNKAGLKLISNKIQKYLSRAKDENYQIRDKYEMDDFLEFASKLQEDWDNKRIIEFAKDHNRLKSLGIESNEMLRALLREFIQYKGGIQEVDKVKTLERGLAGKKVGIDFFPTPPSVCTEMVEMAEITEGMDVLEPSAGNGNIADAIKSITGVVCDVCEVSSELRAILEAKGYNVVDFDFLSYNDKKYDRIIMNPPFSNRMDGEHIQHAYSLLKPNGRIVAIAGEGIFIGSDKKAVAFRDWIDATNSEVQKLPEKTFTDKSLYATTGANARLIIINKGDEDKEELKETELIEEIKDDSEIEQTEITNEIKNTDMAVTMIREPQNIEENKNEFISITEKYGDFIYEGFINNSYFKVQSDGTHFEMIEGTENFDDYEFVYEWIKNKEIHKNDTIYQNWIRSINEEDEFNFFDSIKERSEKNEFYFEENVNHDFASLRKTFSAFGDNYYIDMKIYHPSKIGGLKQNEITLRIDRDAKFNNTFEELEHASISNFEQGLEISKEWEEKYATPLTVEELAKELERINSEVWDIIGAESSSEIREDNEMQKQYILRMSGKVELSPKMPDILSKDIYSILEDDNEHLLNQFLTLKGYYGEEEKTKLIDNHVKWLFSGNNLQNLKLENFNISTPQNYEMLLDLEHFKQCLEPFEKKTGKPFFKNNDEIIIENSLLKIKSITPTHVVFQKFNDENTIKYSFDALVTLFDKGLIKYDGYNSTETIIFDKMITELKYCAYDSLKNFRDSISSDYANKIKGEYDSLAKKRAKEINDLQFSLFEKNEEIERLRKEKEDAELYSHILKEREKRRSLIPFSQHLEVYKKYTDIVDSQTDVNSLNREYNSIITESEFTDLPMNMQNDFDQYVEDKEYKLNNPIPEPAQSKPTIEELKGRISIINRMIDKGKGNKDELQGRINIINRMIKKYENK